MYYEYHWYRYGGTRIEYGIVQIINLPRLMQGRLLEDSKLKLLKRWRLEDGRFDQRISQSNWNTTTQHSVCTIKHKNRNIEIFWKLNHNVHNWLFYGIFTFLAHFAAKILQFFRFLQISCYLEIILKNSEIFGEVKKILETWQRWPSHMYYAGLTVHNAFLLLLLCVYTSQFIKSMGKKVRDRKNVA